ncbi:MAG: MFS transporter [Bacteriovoracaceae bacterium]|nr:MFS transporter [Bacteriovoracaceae bacterium]
MIISTELIFLLPFVIPRVFRPVLLEGWHISNTQLGFAFSIYGLSAMISYLFGGFFADKFHPKVLISLSLISTALSGFIHLSFKSSYSLYLMYGMFGVTTILLMWSASIRYTHFIGKKYGPSLSMGILDSGRGLVAAAFSTLLTFLFVYFTQNNYSSSKIVDTIYILTIVCMIVLGLVVNKFLSKANDVKLNTIEFSKIIDVLKNKNLIILGIIILCAYCGYKSVDFYSLYMVKKLGFTQQASAKFTTLVLWLRPISAFLGAFVIDFICNKYNFGRLTSIFTIFVIGTISHFLLSFESNSTMIIGLILVSVCFIYICRAVYFSVFDELKIESSFVGTSIGVVSLIGFLPDFFYSPSMGYVLDNYDNAFKIIFMIVGCMFLIGGACTFYLMKSTKR